MEETTWKTWIWIREYQNGSTRKKVGGYGKVTSGSGQQLVVGYCEHGILLL
jgi:hypothetical protein